MDNNPFRNNQPSVSNFQNTGYMTPTLGASQPQPQQQQQQQQPYDGYLSSSTTGYPQQQQQQQQPWQSNIATTGPNTPYSPIQAQNTSYPQQPFSPSYNNNQPPYSSPYNNNMSNTSSSLMSSTTPSSMMSGGGGNNFGDTYQPYQATPSSTTTMPLNNTYTGGYNSGGFNTPILGGYNNGYNHNMMQQPQQPYNNNNFYIPANFGQSTTQQQPKHTPVDASSLLKGTQVKRVECPVCQKMIEGDDMAVNHHVNEHYN